MATPEQYLCLCCKLAVVEPGTVKSFPYCENCFAFLSRWGSELRTGPDVLGVGGIGALIERFVIAFEKLAAVEALERLDTVKEMLPEGIGAKRLYTDGRGNYSSYPTLTCVLDVTDRHV